MLTLRADGGLDIKEYMGATPTLKEMQEAVGGYLETVPHWEQWMRNERTLDVAVFCNEEGKLMQLPVNEFATKEWQAEQSRYGHVLDDVLVGNVIVLYGDAAFMRAL